MNHGVECYFVLVKARENEKARVIEDGGALQGTHIDACTTSKKLLRVKNSRKIYKICSLRSRCARAGELELVGFRQ